MKMVNSSASGMEQVLSSLLHSNSQRNTASECDGLCSCQFVLSCETPRAGCAPDLSLCLAQKLSIH